MTLIKNQGEDMQEIRDCKNVDCYYYNSGKKFNCMHTMKYVEGWCKFNKNNMRNDNGKNKIK